MSAALPSAEPDASVIETSVANAARDRKYGRRVLNQYDVFGEIGRGMHGIVRHGIDTTTGEDVAIKMVRRSPKRRNLSSALRANRDGDPKLDSQEAKIKREIAIMKKCNHQHVVRLREVIDDALNEKIFMVLEYMAGGEVKWRTKSEPPQPVLTLEQARAIFRGVLLGLDYLHHQGIIHRDIKPANLLLDKDGIVKISDFGVSHYSYALRLAAVTDVDDDQQSRALFDDRELSKTAGSPAFYAPELCYQGELKKIDEGNDLTKRMEAASISREPGVNPSAELVADHRSETPTVGLSKKPAITKAIDVWALGVTLFCLLFGKTPLDAQNTYQLIQIIPDQDYAVPDFMGADKLSTHEGEGIEVRDLLSRLMEKDPTRRITLKQVKLVNWVQRGLVNPSEWVRNTAPERRDSVAISAHEAEVAITGKQKAHRFRGALKKMKGILQKSHRDSSSLTSDQDVGPPRPSGRGALHMTPSLRIDTSPGSGGASSFPSWMQGDLPASDVRTSSDVAMSAYLGSPSCSSPRGTISRLTPNYHDWLHNIPLTDSRTPRSSSPAVSAPRPISAHPISVSSSSSNAENRAQTRPRSEMSQLRPIVSTPTRGRPRQLPQASHPDSMSQRRSVDPSELNLATPSRTVTKPRSSSASLLATPLFSPHRLRNRSSNVSVTSTPASVVDDQPSSSATGTGRKTIWRNILPWKHRHHSGTPRPSQKTNPPSAASSELEPESESEGLRSPLTSSAGGTSPFRTPSSTAPSVVRGRIPNLRLGMSPMLSGAEGGQASVDDPEGDTPLQVGEEADYEYEDEDWAPDNWSDDDSFELDEDPNHAVSMFGAGGLLSVQSGEPTRRALTFSGGEGEVWEEERVGSIGGQRLSEDPLEGYWSSSSPLAGIHPNSPWTSPHHHGHQNTGSSSSRSQPSQPASRTASGPPKVEPPAHLLDQYVAALERRQSQPARRSQPLHERPASDDPVEAQEESDTGSSDEEGGFRLPQKHR